MKKVLFVCHGNICRSASAEFIFNDLITKNHLENILHCESRAASTEEIGNDLYAPMRPYLIKRGIPLYRHYAKQITKSDYDEYDLILAFDDYNIRLMSYRINDKEHKIHLLTEYVGETGIIDDPWYTREFDKCLDDITRCCEKLINLVK